MNRHKSSPEIRAGVTIVLVLLVAVMLTVTLEACAPAPTEESMREEYGPPSLLLRDGTPCWYREHFNRFICLED